MTIQDLLNEFDGIVEVSELYKRCGEYRMSGTDVIEGLADSWYVNPEEFDTDLKTAPVMVDEALEKTGDDDPGSELMMYRLAEFAYENDYDYIRGCVALERPAMWLDPEERLGEICGIGYSADDTRYLFYCDGSPWYENLNLYEVEGSMFVEHYLEMDYACVEPYGSRPFWKGSVTPPLDDWPPEFAE